VFLNGRRIHGETPIGDSAQIKVGDFYLHVESSPSSATPSKGLDFVRLHGRNLGAVGRTYRLTSRVNLVGRGRDCSVTIIDASVSRIHSKLTVDVDGTVHVEDLKSANGTYLNDQPVEHATLADNDILRIGNVELRVEFVDPMTVTGVTSQHSGGVALSDIPAPPSAGRPGRVSPLAFWSSMGTLLIAFVILGAVVLSPPPPGPSLKARVPTTRPDSAAPNDPSDERNTSVENGVGNPVVEEAPLAPPLESPSEPSDPSKLVEDSLDEPEDAEKTSVAAGGEDAPADALSPEEVGTGYLANREWKPAIALFSRLLAVNPLDESLGRHHNRAILELHNQSLVDSATEKRAAHLHGDALTNLHEITEGSVYRAEADATILQMLGKKHDTLQRARSQCRRLRLQACHDLYTDAHVLDPSDSLVKHERAQVAARLKR